MNLCNEFLVGADPEFIIKDGNRLVSPSRFIQDVYFNYPLGYDHGGTVAECRPSPTRSTLQLTKNIRTLLLQKTPEEFAALHNAGKWIAGAWKEFPGNANPACLGGHLHFGVELRASTRGSERRTHRGQVTVQALDKLTKHLEALDILPTKECESRRSLSSYGHFGEVRYSGERHFEYRSMCSWLFHPEVAALVLTLGKLCVRFPFSLDAKLDTPNYSLQTLEEIVAKGAQRHNDDDCLWVWEKLLASKKNLHHHPDEDFRATWESIQIGE